MYYDISGSLLRGTVGSETFISEKQKNPQSQTPRQLWIISKGISATSFSTAADSIKRKAKDFEVQGGKKMVTSEAKRLQCPQCAKKFSRTDHLKRHQLRRKGPKDLLRWSIGLNETRFRLKTLFVRLLQ